MFDVSIIDPGSLEYRKPGQRPLGAASTAERKKSSIYDDRCREQGILFTPFIFEYFGGIGVKGKDLIVKIGDEGALNAVKKINGTLAMEGSRRSRERL